mgnify:CR=1 FL=1
MKAISLETSLVFISGIFLFLFLDIQFWLEISVAYSISLINVIIGYCLTVYAFPRSNKIFYRQVYLGMLLRMAAVLSISLFLIFKGYLLATPFFLSLMLFYVIHQWTEIINWLKILPQQKVILEG